MKWFKGDLSYKCLTCRRPTHKFVLLKFDVEELREGSSLLKTKKRNIEEAIKSHFPQSQKVVEIPLPFCSKWCCQTFRRKWRKRFYNPSKRIP